MSWDRRLDLHIDVDAPSSRALLNSATDSSVLSIPPELVAGDKLIVRVHFWRRGSVPGSLEAIDPGDTATFVFSGRPHGVPADSPVLFLADDFAEVETGVWETAVDLNTEEIIAHLAADPAGAKTITAEIEVRDAGDTSRRSIQFPARVLPQVWSNDDPPAQAAPADAVRHSAQTLTDGQKKQARTNIGADGIWRNHYPVILAEDYTFLSFYSADVVWEFTTTEFGTDRQIVSTFFQMGTAGEHKGAVTADDGSNVLSDTSASVVFSAFTDQWILAVGGRTFHADGAVDSNLENLEWVDDDNSPVSVTFNPTRPGTLLMLTDELWVFAGGWRRQKIDTSGFALSGEVVKLSGAQTVAGEKTFSGQVELTGQTAANPTSAATRDWVSAMFAMSPRSHTMIPFASGTVTGSGSTVGAPSRDTTLVTIGNTLDASARVKLTDDFGFMDANAGYTFGFATPFLLRVPLAFGTLGGAGAFVIRVYACTQGTMTLPPARSHPFQPNTRGLCAEFRQKFSGTGWECRLCSRDGHASSPGSEAASAWSEISPNNTTKHYDVTLSSSGTGTAKLFVSAFASVSGEFPASAHGAAVATLTGAGVPATNASVATFWTRPEVAIIGDGVAALGSARYVKIFPCTAVYGASL